MEGTIIKGIGGFYYVNVGENIIECKARGKFRNDKVTPMVGDKVRISVVNGKGSIEEIHKRSSMLIRPLVANVTQAFVVFSIKKPDINLDLLNKFLLLCEYHEIDAIVVFNKCDLANDKEKKYYTNILKLSGYETIFVEAKNKYNLEALKDKIKDNITVFCGPSGVGKSTISNNVLGRSLMETGEISEKLKRGKHTTRHSELIEVEGGFVVDTPGFSNVNIADIKEDDIKNYIKDFYKYNGLCKFSSCNHSSEPKCAVKEAVEKGEISKERYEFYLRILDDAKKGRSRR